MSRMKGRSMDIIHPKYDPSMKEEPKKAKPKTKNALLKKNPENTSGRDNFWPMYLLGILVVAVIVFFGVRAASSLVDVWTDLSPSTINESANVQEAATETVPTEEAAVTEEATTETTTPEVATGEDTTPVATVNKADLKIKVLNGSGVSGAASTGQAELVAAGFTIDSVGNAKKFNYDTTIVYYPTGKADNAQLVADALTSYSASIEENSVADGYDALVVIGDK